MHGRLPAAVPHGPDCPREIAGYENHSVSKPYMTEVRFNPRTLVPARTRPTLPRQECTDI